VRQEGFDIAFSGLPGVNGAQTDWLAARRIGAPRDAGQLAYLLSGLARHASVAPVQ
jgi:hypothetical protein